MAAHTSKLLTLEPDPPECECGHPEERHHVQWIPRAVESQGVVLNIPIAKVHCQRDELMAKARELNFLQFADDEGSA